MTSYGFSVAVVLRYHRLHLLPLGGAGIGRQRKLPGGVPALHSSRTVSSQTGRHKRDRDEKPKKDEMAFSAHATDCSISLAPVSVRSMLAALPSRLARVRTD